jgi:hypothetical protein
MERQGAFGFGEAPTRPLRPVDRSGRLHPSAELLAGVARRYEAGESSYDIAKSLGVYDTTVGRWLRKLGAPRRTLSEAKRNRHPLNENAFDIITEQSAYWAGFLMADGCVHNGGRGEPQAVKLSLKESDADHVRAFLGFLGSDLEPQCKAKRGGHSADSREAVVSVRSHRLVAALARFGVVARKTATAEVRLLEGNRHFWRGMIDGDGSVGWQRRRWPAIGLCGTEAVVEQFSGFVRTLAPECRANKNRDHSIWAIRLAGRHAFAVIERLYRDCGPALPRKRLIAEDIIRAYDPTDRRQGPEIAAFEESKIASDWARDPRCQVTAVGLAYRLRLGMDPEAAISQPRKTHRANLCPLC